MFSHCLCDIRRGCRLDMVSRLDCGNRNCCFGGVVVVAVVNASMCVSLHNFVHVKHYLDRCSN